MSTLPLRCRCGRVQGVVTEVSPSAGNRVVCYCDDCQAFGRFLGRSDVVDAHGGTDIFQVAPCRVKISAGTDALRCVRLSSKGLYRWYADCCRTPTGNTLPRFPFIGMPQPFIDHATDGRPRDEVLGKPLGLIQGRFAVGGMPPGAHRIASPGLFVRCGSRYLSWWLTGKGTRSPYFDAKTRAPRIEPRVLTADEREALRPSPAAAATR